jgi:hypothetical protein
VELARKRMEDELGADGQSSGEPAQLANAA